MLGRPLLRGNVDPAEETAMTRLLHRRPKSPRFLALAAGIALATALSGCVVYPAGPGYYHPHYHYHYDRDWR